MTAAQTIYLKDYTAPNYLIKKTFLTFELSPSATRVTSTLHFEANPEVKMPEALILDGQELKLISVSLNGEALPANAFECDEDTLRIPNVPEQFELTCVTEISPEKNLSFEGLYKSRTMYCTQCEAEGFRKITYYLDRPDVLSEFTTKVIADKQQFPVLLSNGNAVEQGDLEDGKHFVIWHDPFKKPAYLFALVAGDLEYLEDTFTTMTDREITLRIFVEPKDLDKCDHAMTSLKHSMAWDERVYGREYDLDIFMIVAVDDFNMGAMENKGLNIFNTSCVLANPKTTTDAGFARVEGVVAHEYFHNWSGNRVTCRDWFQLSLKEGFTVFRDQEFSADMGSATVKRVEDVSFLRTLQFAEDAGPMAHPVQPPSYMEISNFYTLTVYEKGAEIVRMYRTLLGADTFRKATDIYFDRHDGEAATVEDFIAAMRDASGRDFTQFKHWYTQAGTPVVKTLGVYDSDKKTFTLTMEQFCPDTPEAKSTEKKPFHIPVDISLVGENGEQSFSFEGKQGLKNCVVELTQATQSINLHDVHESPVPVLFRGFSAPVKSAYNYKKIDLLRILKFESDGFSRFDAMQQLAVVAIFDVMASMRKGEKWTIEPLLVESFTALLQDTSLDAAMVALMCNLPEETYLSGLATPIEVDRIAAARRAVKKQIADHLSDLWLAVYERCSNDTEYVFNATEVARRSLKNTALDYLMTADPKRHLELCEHQFSHSDNMTEQAAALRILVHNQTPDVEVNARQALINFYGQWQNEALVVNLWLSIQAGQAQPGAIDKIKSLMNHPAYDAHNPNKIRSVVGVFCNQNLTSFHAVDGSGYELLKTVILELNKTNPQIASRLLVPLTKWKKYDIDRQALMKKALEDILAEPKLSKDVYEVVSKSLDN